MLSALCTSNMVPIVINRHQKDRLLIACRNPNVAALIVQGAPGQVQPLTQWQSSTGVLGARINAAGQFTNPVGATQVESFGALATATANYAIAIGCACVISGSNTTAIGTFSTISSSNVTAVGYQVTTAGNNDVLIGYTASGGGSSVAVGYNANASAGSAIAIGTSVTAGAKGVAVGSLGGCNAQSVALGYGCSNTASNQFCVGGGGGGQAGINAVYFGGTTNASGAGSVVVNTFPCSVTINATGGSGSNIAGGNLTLCPGISTGNAAPATVIIQGTVAIGSSSTAQTLTTIVTFSGVTQNVLVQAIAATVIPVVCRGAASQSSDLQQWQNSSSSVLARVGSDGTISTTVAIGIGTTSPSGLLHVTSGSFNPLIIERTGSAFAQGLQFRSSGSGSPGIKSGDQIVRIMAMGMQSNGSYPAASSALDMFTCYATEDWTTSAQGRDFRVYVTPNGTSSPILVLTAANNGAVTIANTVGTTTVGLTIKGSSGTTVDLVDICKSDGTVYYGFEKFGRPYTGGTTPSISAGAGAGTSPTVSITGTDVNGVVSVTTGSLPTGSAIVVTVSFANAWGTAPKTVHLQPGNVNAAGLSALTMVWVPVVGDTNGISTTIWTIMVGATGLTAATLYKWHYKVTG